MCGVPCHGGKKHAPICCARGGIAKKFRGGEAFFFYRKKERFLLRLLLYGRVGGFGGLGWACYYILQGQVCVVCHGKMPFFLPLTKQAYCRAVPRVPINTTHYGTSMARESTRNHCLRCAGSGGCRLCAGARCRDIAMCMCVCVPCHWQNRQLIFRNTAQKKNTVPLPKRLTHKGGDATEWTGGWGSIAHIPVVSCRCLCTRQAHSVKCGVCVWCVKNDLRFFKRL